MSLDTVFYVPARHVDTPRSLLEIRGGRSCIVDICAC